jgi:hypothetical protein
MKGTLKPLSIIVVMILTTLVLLYIKDKKEETYIITLKNKTTFKATVVIYYTSGIADIKKTNNERIQIPIQAIKQIKIRENK